jgi:hypothetical protein
MKNAIAFVIASFVLVCGALAQSGPSGATTPAQQAPISERGIDRITGSP